MKKLNGLLQLLITLQMFFPIFMLSDWLIRHPQSNSSLTTTTTSEVLLEPIVMYLESPKTILTLTKMMMMMAKMAMMLK